MLFIKELLANSYNIKAQQLFFKLQSISTITIQINNILYSFQYENNKDKIFPYRVTKIKRLYWNSLIHLKLYITYYVSIFMIKKLINNVFV